MISLQEKINIDIKQAMIDKAVDRLSALRAAKASFIVEMTKDGSKSITDEIAEKIILKLVKQRKESASIFRDQKRYDLEKDEIMQIEYLQEYLPEQMQEIEIRVVVKKIIQDVGASSLSDIGKCMGPLMKRLEGKADGKLVSRLVREELSS